MAPNKTSLGVPHISPTIREGHCSFVMEEVIESPDGLIILSLNAARHVNVRREFHRLSMGATSVEILAWLEERMREMMVEAKEKLGVPDERTEENS